MNEKFKNFIFDLDGTLLDTVDDLTTAFNYMRRKLDFPEVSREKIKKMIGNGMRDVIEQSFAESQPMKYRINTFTRHHHPCSCCFFWQHVRGDHLRRESSRRTGCASQSPREP